MSLLILIITSSVFLYSWSARAVSTPAEQCAACVDLGNTLENDLTTEFSKDKYSQWADRLDYRGRPMLSQRAGEAFYYNNLYDHFCDNAPNKSACFDVFGLLESEVFEWFMEGREKEGFVQAVCYNRLPGCKPPAQQEQPRTNQTEPATNQTEPRTNQEKLPNESHWSARTMDRLSSTTSDWLHRAERSITPHLQRAEQGLRNTFQRLSPAMLRDTEQAVVERLDQLVNALRSYTTQLGELAKRGQTNLSNQARNLGTKMGLCHQQSALAGYCKCTGPVCEWIQSHWPIILVTLVLLLAGLPLLIVKLRQRKTTAEHGRVTRTTTNRKKVTATTGSARYRRTRSGHATSGSERED